MEIICHKEVFEQQDSNKQNVTPVVEILLPYLKLEKQKTVAFNLLARLQYRDTILLNIESLDLLVY